MKYTKLTTLFLIFLTIQMFSQDSNSGKFKIGLNLGANLSDFKGNVLDDYNKVTSYSFGLSAEYIINEKLSLLSNINYDNKAMKLENFRNIEGNGDTYFLDNTIKFNYINIPINIRYNIGKNNKIFADAGIFYNHFLNVKNSTTRKDTGEKITQFSLPLIKKHDYGILIGFGYRFDLNSKNYLNIIIRDEFGLPNIFDNVNNPLINIKTNTLKLILNWQLLL